MTDTVLKMPRLGETMEEGIISTWLVAPGEAFRRGDMILVVETDKTAVEFPALGPGVLKQHLKHEGDLVLVGEPIATIDLGGKPDWTVQTGGQDHDGQEESRPVSPTSAVHVHSPAERLLPSALVRATPAARRLARLVNLDLAGIAGTGRRGRIEREDVELALSAVGDGTVEFFREIACTFQGPVRGSPFLMMHGFSGDRTTFASLADGLSRAGCRVVALDLPGHGATRLEAENPRDLSTNMTEFAAAALGAAPFHLVAHSLGAVPALELARRIPLASLTLIAPAGLGPKLDREFISGMAAPRSADHVRSLLGRLTQRPLVLSDAAIGKLHGELARGRLRALAGSLSGPAEEALDIRPALEKVAAIMPVRVLSGHKDRIVDWQDTCTLPCGVAVHHFSESGHMVHWDQPGDVLKILLQGSAR